MKTILVVIIGLIIATAWAQIDSARDVVWLPAETGMLNGQQYQKGLRNDGVVVWRWFPPRH